MDQVQRGTNQKVDCFCPSRDILLLFYAWYLKNYKFLLKKVKIKNIQVEIQLIQISTYTNLTVITRSIHSQIYFFFNLYKLNLNMYVCDEAIYHIFIYFTIFFKKNDDFQTTCKNRGHSSMNRVSPRIIHMHLH